MGKVETHYEVKFWTPDRKHELTDAWYYSTYATTERDAVDRTVRNAGHKVCCAFVNGKLQYASCRQLIDRHDLKDEKPTIKQETPEMSDSVKKIAKQFVREMLPHDGLVGVDTGSSAYNDMLAECLKEHEGLRKDALELEIRKVVSSLFTSQGEFTPSNLEDWEPKTYRKPKAAK